MIQNDDLNVIQRNNETAYGNKAAFAVNHGAKKIMRRILQARPESPSSQIKY